MIDPVEADPSQDLLTADDEVDGPLGGGVFGGGAEEGIDLPAEGDPSLLLGGEVLPNAIPAFSPEPKGVVVGLGSGGGGGGVGVHAEPPVWCGCEWLYQIVL